MYAESMTSQHIRFPRTTADQRKFLFETWEASQDVTASCRRAHVARGTFYYWQPRFETGGYAALEQCQSHAAKEPAHTAQDIEQRVIDLRRQNPKWGKRRIADELSKANHWVPLISPNTVKRIGCVSFELKVWLLSGKVCLPKPLQERNHDFQLTSDYTRYSC